MVQSPGKQTVTELPHDLEISVPGIYEAWLELGAGGCTLRFYILNCLKFLH